MINRHSQLVPILAWFCPYSHTYVRTFSGTSIQQSCERFRRDLNLLMQRRKPCCQVTLWLGLQSLTASALRCLRSRSKDSQLDLKHPYQSPICWTLSQRVVESFLSLGRWITNEQEMGG